MRIISFLISLALACLGLAAPVERRTASAADILVFQFADVLEQLESQFYSQGLSKFQEQDFLDAGFTSAQIPIQLITGIQNDEMNHASFLESGLTALGGSPISGCSFDFSSVLTDVNTMVATARVVENVGVGAYLGGATLLDDPILLDEAGSILTIEARHQTILNVLNLGTAIPQSFDIALSPSEVLAIAGGFVSGCSIPIPANSPLAITNTGSVAPGTQLTFSSPAINGSTDNLFCQMIVGGQPAAIALPFNQCVVPQGINGPVAIFITADGQPLINNIIDRADQPVIAGPAMTFIDTQPQMLGMLARNSVSNSTSNSTSNSSSNSTSSSSSNSTASSTVFSITTQTISPAQANSIIQSVAASSTATDSSASSTAPPSSSTAPPSNASANGPAGGSPVSIDGWTSVSAIPSPAA